MAECLKCGTTTVPGEAFCSNCGTKNPPAQKSPQEPEDSTLSYEDEAESGAAAEAKAPETANPAEGPASAEISGEISGADFESSVSLGGKTTDEVPVDPPHIKHTVKKGNTGGGHQGTRKEHAPSSLLDCHHRTVPR